MNTFGIWAPLAIVAVIAIGWFAYWKVKNGPRDRVLKTGRPGEATILDTNVIESSEQKTILLALVVDVRLPGQAEYRAPVRQWFPRYVTWLIKKGDVVPVRVDPNDPQLVYVDGDLALKRIQDQQAAARDEGERRQAALLRGGKPD
jgi:hypothetical protein